MTSDDLKYFKERIKLIFSSLFARNMSHAVFGIPELKDNQILFTNVSPDKIEIYESEPNYFFHLVTLKEDRFCNLLFNLYPVLKTHIVILNVREFMSCINKSINKLEQSKITLSGQDFIFSCEELSTVCGLLTSEYIADHYYQIYQGGIPEGDEPYHTNLTVDQIDPKAITYLDICDKDTGSLQKIMKSRCMLLQGKNLFSTKEYLVKSKELDNYKITLTAAGQSRALRVMVTLDCPSVSVISVQPGIRYYAHDVI